MPRSAARNAYELLQRVCDAIQEEPKRYNQGVWKVIGKRVIAKRFGADRVPPCGTIGCRAGWIVVLHDGVDRLKRMPSHRWGFTPVADRANEILALGGRATDDFFSGAALCDVSAVPGTHAYVNAGVSGIRKFMKRHARHLKARLLKDVPK